jgi:putative redox protein
MHNVHVDRIEETQRKAKDNPSVATLAVELRGDWRSNPRQKQFGGTVKFPEGETLFEADFPPFLGGEGRAPSPLMYCFYGAMCCYGATFATQAAMAGVELKGLRIGLKLSVDFRTALGLGGFTPLSAFNFEVEVDTTASDADVQRVKQLADARCPAIWAMENKVPYSTKARRVTTAAA